MEEIQNQKSTEKIIMIALTVALVICLIIIFTLIKKQGNIAVVPSEQNQEAQGQAVSSLSAEEVKAIQDEAMSNCSQADFSAEDKASCASGFYAQKASQERKENVCDLVTDKDQKTACLDGVYMGQAVGGEEGPNIEACQKISEENQRVACSNEIYYYLAMKNPDKAKDYCNKITTGLKNTCLTKFAK